MANYEPLMNLGSGAMGIDKDRNPACVPGYLVHSAQMNEDAVICYNRSRCFCMNPEVVSKRTYVDVYSNGVLMNVPTACCCCIWNDHAKFIYYDRFIGEATTVGCCSPCPYPCPHCCGCCGEPLGFKKGCGCPSGAAHTAYATMGCCCPLDVLLGLEQGQGEILSQQINAAKANFEQAGNRNPPMQAAQVGQMAVGNAMQKMGIV